MFLGNFRVFVFFGNVGQGFIVVGDDKMMSTFEDQWQILKEEEVYGEN